MLCLYLDISFCRPRIQKDIGTGSTKRDILRKIFHFRARATASWLVGCLADVWRRHWPIRRPENVFTTSGEVRCSTTDPDPLKIQTGHSLTDSKLKFWDRTNQNLTNSKKKNPGRTAGQKANLTNSNPKFWAGQNFETGQICLPA